MLFLVHHSTGALILDAQDRRQVLSWTERQLGIRSPQVSVMELKGDSDTDWVERSGTGIQAGSMNGCEAKLSFMADSVHRVAGLNCEKIKPVDWQRTTELRSGNSTVH